MSRLFLIRHEYSDDRPKLCCVTLALTDGKHKNQMFTIKYHAMSKVKDFLILKQTFRLYEMNGHQVIVFVAYILTIYGGLVKL